MITKINRGWNFLKIITQDSQKKCQKGRNMQNWSFQPTIYLLRYSFSQAQKRKIFQQIQQLDSVGTQYTNWILARSQSYNHDIAHLKRKFLKDRFSIHKLTNIKFLCALANHKTQYTLTTNQKIILLAQLNHVFNIIGKQKRFYNEFNILSNEIIQELRDPHDLVCLGTFLAALTNLGNFKYDLWLAIMDSLIVKKSDEQYDQIFGIVYALTKYKQQIMQITEYHQVKNNIILQFIPVIYRNNIQLIRQFIKYNIYNLKQCRILFKCLHSNKINQRYFWKSINDWFNVYVKEQVGKKHLEQFFIVNEKAVEKVINDDGVIRPRSILEELTEIAYILSDNLTNNQGILQQRDKYPLRRFLQFVEDLVLYTIQNGSALYQDYLVNHKHKIQKETPQTQLQDQQLSSQSPLLNQDFEAKTQQQSQRIKIMQRDYKTLFLNPIQIKNETIIQLIVVIRKCCGYDSQGNVPQKQSQNLQAIYKSEQSNQDQIKNKKQKGQQNLFVRPEHLMEINVLKWLVMRLCKQQMDYSISQLLQLINSQDFLRFSGINLDQLILSKLKSIRSTEVSLKDLRKLMLFLPIDSFEQLQPILTSFIYKSHPSQILQLTKIIQMQSVSQGDQEYPPEYPRKEQKQKWLPHLTFFFQRLPELVNNHEKYYSFEENCYFLYYLLKSQVYWQKYLHENNYLGQMEILRQSVKVTSYSRGFKLQMNSYFYKLLNYVDLVEFFEGGKV